MRPQRDGLPTINRAQHCERSSWPRPQVRHASVPALLPELAPPSAVRGLHRPYGGCAGLAVYALGLGATGWRGAGGAAAVALQGARGRTMLTFATPVRSTDSLGGTLPPLAHETQPPGFWKADDGQPGGIVPDTGAVLDFNAAPAPAAPAAAPAQSAPATDTRPVGVHVVDTAEGKVIYYPYVPASVGPLVAAAESGHAAAGRAGGGGLSGVGEAGTPAVLQQPGGDWVAPGGNYKALSQALVSGQNSKEIRFLQKELRRVKSRAKKRLQRVQGKVRAHARCDLVRLAMALMRAHVCRCGGSTRPSTGFATRRNACAYSCGACASCGATVRGPTRAHLAPRARRASQGQREPTAARGRPAHPARQGPRVKR